MLNAGRQEEYRHHSHKGRAHQATIARSIFGLGYETQAAIRRRGANDGAFLANRLHFPQDAQHEADDENGSENSHRLIAYGLVDRRFHITDDFLDAFGGRV